MDQDKGSLGSIQDILLLSALFHCSFHCHQNTKKKFGGELGDTPDSCLWMFNLLGKCSNARAVMWLREKYELKMRPGHRTYLNSIKDHEQFPAVHCNEALKEEVKE